MTEPDASGESTEGRDVDEASTEMAGKSGASLAELVDVDELTPDGDGSPEPPFDPADLDVDEELVDRVAETSPSDIAREIATLQLRIAALEGETADLEAAVEDLESRLARKQADFQNYKQRQQERLEDEKARATEDLVERLLDVRDNLARALEQDEDADIRGGVESTLGQLDREFEREDVEAIEPAPGEPTDPGRHEVLMRVESDEPEGTVADVHRPGYAMAGKVLRPAQVTVSEGSNDGAETDAEDGSAEEES
jgi:molecular chaperone GrpE